MSTFIMAMSINPTAKREHKDLSHQIDESLEVFHQHKVKGLKLFATLGRYDLLALFEADDQTNAFRIASEIGNKSILDTETWPVIPYDEFTQLMH